MTKKEKANDVLQAEKEAMKHSGPTMANGEGDQNVDEATIEAVLTESGADADAVMPAEAAAVHTDTESAEAASGDVKPTKKSTKKTTADRIVAAKPKHRSAKYLAASAKRTSDGVVALSKAIDDVKATSYTKFDGTVELHLRLITKKKDLDPVRGLVQLPGGAPKQVKAVLLTEALIDEILTTKRADADLYLATPAMMPKVAKVAKILGPQGKMPNPKTGTVTDNPDAVMTEIQSGRVEYRSDAQYIIHVGVGKVSWESDRLTKNVQALVGAIGAQRLRSASLTSTMGLGIQVDLGTLE